MKAFLSRALRNAAIKAGLYARLSKMAPLRRLKRRLFPEKHPLLRLLETRPGFSIEPLRLLDVGARGGIQPRWRSLLAWLEVVGFEPDEKECAFLNAFFQRDGERVTVYPVALADGDGMKTLYLTGSQNSSGLLRANPSFVARLHRNHMDNLRVVEERMIETTSIDGFLTRQGVAQPDFIKIDVEGAELLVLKGARRTLAGNALLGVETEVWLGPIKDPNSFARIDTLLREHRLHLFNIALARYPRNAFPQGFLVGRFANRVDPGLFGQPLTGDLVYLRDPVWELETGEAGFEWSDSSVVKMALVYSIYDLPDCAIELLRAYRENYDSRLPFEDMLDTLTPIAPLGRRLRYPDYLALAERRSTDRRS